ncbi:class I SAM-dependent methyltransferase [Pseudomonadota bacterium]
MSSYEDYSKIAAAYDGTRSAIGVEIITGCLGMSSVPLAQQYLLDAGCGTGNYSRAMIDHVARVAAVDMNAHMLEQAKAKFSGPEASRVGFHQSGIDSLPFEASVFDGVMINQVLHHIEDDASLGYPKVSRVISELARVLKPGGSLIINSCSHRQIESGFWYGMLMPEEIRMMRDRHVPLPDLRSVLERCGFDYQGSFVPVDAMMQGRAYLDPLGPLDAEWRKGDSLWSTLTADRLDEVCSRIRQLADAGQLGAFVQEHDALRKDIGQMTFMHARRA